MFRAITRIQQLLATFLMLNLLVITSTSSTLAAPPPDKDDPQANYPRTRTSYPTPPGEVTPAYIGGDCWAEILTNSPSNRTIEAVGHQVCWRDIVHQDMAVKIYRCGQTWFGGCQFASFVTDAGYNYLPGPGEFTSPPNGAQTTTVGPGCYQARVFGSITYVDGYRATAQLNSDVYCFN